MTSRSKLPDKSAREIVRNYGNQEVQSNNSPLSQNQFSHVWTKVHKAT